MKYGTGKPFNKHTIKRDGSGQHVGTIAELDFTKKLVEERVSFTFLAGEKNGTDLAVLLKGKDGQYAYRAVDVKAKERNVPPSHDYDAHVNTYLKRHHCNIYVFYSVTDDKPTLMGWCTKEEFWSQCEIVHAGDADGDEFREHRDSGKLKYNKLRPIHTLLALK